MSDKARELCNYRIQNAKDIVEEVKKWVDKEYETGRVTAITDSELEKVIKESSEKLGINF